MSGKVVRAATGKSEDNCVKQYCNKSEILSTPLATRIQRPEVQAEIRLENSAKMLGKQAVSCAKDAGAWHIQPAK